MGGNLVETLMGAVVLAVAGAFLVFAYSSAGTRVVDGYTLTAKFNRVDGLTLGSDVRMSGIKVGTVIDQTLDLETFYAVVKMEIDSSIELPDDSSIKVTSEGLLGGNYLALEPGGSEDLLGAGDEVEHTQGSVDLMALISQAVFSAGSGSKTQTAE